MDAKKAKVHQPNLILHYVKEFSGLIAALLLALVIVQFGFQSYQVFGQSMEPTLSEGNYLLISKLGSTWARVKGQDYVPNRGDIVVLSSPRSDTRLIKRVVALPGERVVIKDGAVKVFNSTHPEGFDPYQELGLDSSFTDGNVVSTIPEHHVFVIGDNRQAGNSSDSRNDLGPIHVDNIIGQLLVRIWPL